MSDTNVSAPTAPEATPSGGTPSTTGASAAPAPSATPQGATPTGATSPEPQIPNGYVPSYRIRETREAAIREAQQLYAQREAQYQAQLEQVQRQLQALAGVTPQEVSEDEAIRQQFGKVFPKLAQLEAKSEDLMKFLEQGGTIESLQQRIWGDHARNTLNTVFSQMGKAFGGELNDAQKRGVHRSFVRFVEESPENQERFAQNDPSVVEDFVKDFTSAFIDPMRRNAAVAATSHVNPTLPQDRPGSGIPTVGAPKLANMDERAAAAWQAWQTRGSR